MNQSDENRKYVEAIKLAAGSVQYKNLSVQETMVGAVTELYKYYEYTKNMNYLETAILQIQAYLELGFVYDNAKSQFDQVLEKMGTTREIQFPKRFYVSKQIKLNKTQVRSMIKKWPASSKQNMKIDEVVEDIIKKVKAHDTGIYYYPSAIPNELYELVINEKESFFHDLQRGVFYTFLI